MIYLFEIENKYYFSNYTSNFIYKENQYLPHLIEEPLLKFTTMENALSSDTIELKILETQNKITDFVNSSKVKIFTCEIDFFGNVTNVNLVYRGIILNIASSNNVIIFNCGSIFRLLNRTIGNFFSPTCRASLGDNKCKVNIEQYAITGSILEIVGVNKIVGIHENSFAKDYFNLGFVNFFGQKFQIAKEDNGLIETINSLPVNLKAGG
jgi:hypothetical protein